MIAASDGGYDVELLQDVSSDLYCVICLKLMRNPVQFNCGHGMCYGCFKNLLHKAKQKNVEPQCPQCREIVRESQIVSNVMLHRLILSMQVQCFNEVHGCLWIGTLSELDHHLKTCSKNFPQSKSQTKQRSDLYRKKDVDAVPDTVHGNLLLSILDSLTSLHDKFDDMHEKLSNSGYIRNVENNNFKEEMKKCKSRKTSSSFVETYTWLWQKFSAIDESKYFGVCLVAVLIVIYFLTAMLFSSFEALPSAPSNIPASVDVTPSFVEDVNGKNDFFTPDKVEVIEKLDALLARMDKQFQSIFDVISHQMKCQVFNLRINELQVLEELPDFYLLQNRTMGELQNRFAYLMEQSRIDINANISHYDARSLDTLSVDNVESLTHMALPIFHSLSKQIFQDINFAHFHASSTVENIYKRVRTKLWDIRQKVDFSAKTTFGEENYFSKQLRWYNKMLVEMRENITRSYKSVDKDKLLTAVSHDFLSLKLRYEHTLNNYHQNITRVLTQEQRFANLMHRVQNVDLLNGRFVWRLNASKVNSSLNSDVFKSRKFQTGSRGRGMLFLYKDKTRPGYFKLTFIQFKSHPITIGLSVMSQIRPEVLICFETHVGKSPGKTKAKVVKYYSVPMKMTELVEKGFVKDNKMFVRCLTDDHHE